MKFMLRISLFFLPLSLALDVGSKCTHILMARNKKKHECEKIVREKTREKK